MHSSTASRTTRLLRWQRVREFAVPPTMIDKATARRVAGDWAGACAAARVDTDLSLRRLARTHGHELAAEVRADLRRLAPDLLRWHLPRVAPDGLLRPGLTVSLARYRAVHLVARTAPAWAEAGQRISLAVWDGSRAGPHPHPHPDRRFRFDLHRHLWAADQAAELRERCGEPAATRWAAEAAILLRADGHQGGTAIVRVGRRRHLKLELAAEPGSRPAPHLRLNERPWPPAAAWRITEIAGGSGLPVLPEAATWTLPDLELLRADLIDPGRLHPLVAAALVPGFSSSPEPRAADDGAARFVDCRGARHRLGLVGGVLAALDHDPAEIRREELLVAFGGPPLPCLRVIDDAHRSPERLDDVRARLDHGDAAGALATVERLLGPDALLRSGSLRDELESAAWRRTVHGLFRAGLTGDGPGPATRPVGRTRARLRNATA